jgi:hypothetical protein
LWSNDGNFSEEDVEPEKGCQLPAGINDPAKVKETDLRPVRSRGTKDKTTDTTV